MSSAPVAASGHAPAAADAAHAAAAHGAEHGGGVFPPFDPSTFASQLVWFAISFGALYWVLSRYALPAVQAVLDRRASALKSDLEEAARQTAEAEAAKKAMEAGDAAARANARAQIEAARASAQAEIAAQQARVDTEIAAAASAAEERLRTARAAAMANVRTEAEGVAREIVARFAPGARA